MSCELHSIVKASFKASICEQEERGWWQHASYDDTRENQGQNETSHWDQDSQLSKET
jgi:hypothetical protein